MGPEEPYDLGMVAPDDRTGPPVLPFALFTAVIVAVAFLLPPMDSGSAPGEIERTLKSELESRVGRVVRWQRDRERALESLADEPRLRGALKEGADLDRELARACLGFDGCAVYRPDGHKIADFRARSTRRALIERAARGRTTQGPLTWTDSVGRPAARDQSAGRPRWSVSFATPLIEGGAVRAVLVGRARADRQLDPLLSADRPGRTGETYLVGRDGFMVTRSRFDVRPPARRDGPLVFDRPAVAVLDGAGLTRAARAAAHHRSGIDLSGYRDYRGVRVVGAWRWLDELEAGVITEMDAAEAYR